MRRMSPFVTILVLDEAISVLGQRGRAFPHSNLGALAEKLIDFCDICDIGYIRCRIEAMLCLFEIERIPIKWNRHQALRPYFEA